MRRVLVPLLALCAAAGCGSSTPAQRDAAPADDAAAAADAGPAAPYTITALDHVRISSLSTDPNFQKAAGAIDLRDAPFANVTLVLDLGTTCYPFTSWQSDPPPSGQNWPADCDAFDRNFETSIDAAPGAPAIELVRAITPFGGPLHLEIDVTDVANGLPGPHELTVVIPTWSDAAGQVSGSAGGWNVTATLSVTPGDAPRRVVGVVPIFYDSVVDATLPVPLAVAVPAGTTAGRLEVRATGHGGASSSDADCSGPAEEFCDRHLTLSVDGAALAPVNPWRDDCATLCTIAHYGSASGGFDYCQENPCGSIMSVEAPRANWCPGSLTPPFTFDVAALAAPGDHTLDWAFTTGIVAGGQWRMSAYYVAFAE